MSSSIIKNWCACHFSHHSVALTIKRWRLQSTKPSCLYKHGRNFESAQGFAIRCNSHFAYAALCAFVYLWSERKAKFGTVQFYVFESRLPISPKTLLLYLEGFRPKFGLGFKLFVLGAKSIDNYSNQLYINSLPRQARQVLFYFCFPCFFHEINTRRSLSLKIM